MNGVSVWSSWKPVMLGLACVIAAATAGCASWGRPAEGRVTVRPDLQAVFADRGVVGTFALFDPATNHLTLVNPARAERRYPPASTFKIANSLIALETGAVADEEEVIPYGGQPQPFDAWEQDMGMRDAIRISNVPIYQEIARRVGLRRMRDWIDRLDYGNEEIGRVVDRFWLDGPLEISAIEQTHFLARLARQDLPASPRSQSIVRDILRIEEKDGAALFAKTGWFTSAEPNIGWWVGWVERGGKVYAFALNIDMSSMEDAPKRLEIGRKLLAELGAL